MPENKCLFCAIAAGSIPAKKVYEDSSALAILDINPRNPGHTLVLPKKHYSTIFDMPSEDAGNFFRTVRKLASMVSNATKAQGINILQNNGLVAGQMVPHLHFHIIPRFANEGPVSLEGILQIKRMDEKMLDKMAAAIKTASSEAASSAVAEEVEEELPERKPSFEPKPKKEEEEEFEEIGF